MSYATHELNCEGCVKFDCIRALTDWSINRLIRSKSENSCSLSTWASSPTHDLSRVPVQRYNRSKFYHNVRTIEPIKQQCAQQVKIINWHSSKGLFPREQTQPRYIPKVHSYQVGLWSNKNCTREGGNGLSRSNSLINLLRSHLLSNISHEQTQSRSYPKVHPA